MQTKNINQQLSAASINLLVLNNSQSGGRIFYAAESDETMRIHVEVDGNGDKVAANGGSFNKLIPPPYRMPPQPLYSEPASIPGSATPSVQQMHTHSNKFPIEREVILTSYDKNSKIPILNEYHRKQKAATASNSPTVQVAWTEDRPNRTCIDTRSTPNTQSSEGINIEYHRTYKAQPLVLETTNGTEPSPIIHQNDSNGFSVNHSKLAGRSHSTPETENTSKAFPSRTYHTIKDMISSRFNGKTKADQVPETSLNNSESAETPKAENNLSPHSQLVQRGVYLANSQLAIRSSAFGNNDTDVTKRNQQVREQILNQYRERAVDVGQTAITQQIANANSLTNGDCISGQIAPTKRMAAVDCETPNRFREQAGCRSTPRFNGHLPHQVRIERSNETEMHVPLAHASWQPTPHPVHRHYEHHPNHEQLSHNKNYSLLPSSAGGALSKHEEPAAGGPKANDQVSSDRLDNTQQLPADTRYDPVTSAMERCNIARAKSNDHLLEPSNGHSPYARKDLPFKQKSKSFENLGNEHDEQAEKLDGKCAVALSGVSSDYEKRRFGGQSDSGRGSTVYSSGKLKYTTDTSPDSSEPHRVNGLKENQWADMVENELIHILEPKSNASMANSTLSDSSASAVLPPGSPDVSSDDMTTYKHKNVYSGKVDQCRMPSVPSSHSKYQQWSRSNTKEKMHQRLAVSMKRSENSKLPSTVASSSLDLDSMLDEENHSSDDDFSISDTRAIRRQLEGLENMYSEVMKLLGVRKSALNKYQCPDPRLSKRRLYGSVSSLPSSVSSRPVRDRYRRPDDRKKFVRDIKGINKRFQRLESHVVTLARSVAHLSSEMRTQHVMIQEMEVIRNELTNLRAQTNMLTVRSQSIPRFHHFSNTEQMNSSPDKMKKLTKFFGDEPPLLRLFLKKLGYEKYAPVFEKERIGLAELPYMSEERLQKLGIPMGPRLRIIQEAQLGFPGNHENTLCIV